MMRKDTLMSLFYLKNEPHTELFAPTDGTVLSFEATNEQHGESDAVTILSTSTTVASPLKGRITDISNNRQGCTVTGDKGERVKITVNTLNSNTAILINPRQKVTVGTPLFRLESIPQEITLMLDNSEDFKAITVFEGECHTAETEIMTFCKD
jgi:phosphotransferase system IIA component